MEHCIFKIREIFAQKEGDLRSIFQLFFNLGPLSELSGLGREPFWDRWKDPVADWNRAELEKLAQGLPKKKFAILIHPQIPIVEPKDGNWSHFVKD